jgi:PAS domain S-box-containing protein
MQNIDFNAVVSSIPEPMIVLNLEDQVVFVNQEAKRFEDLVPTPITIGAVFSDVVGEGRKELVSNLLLQVKRDQRTLVTEAEYKDAKGRLYFFEVSYSPIISESHRLQYICIRSREITHEKIFQKKASQLLHEYSSLIENANAVIFSVDSRGYVTAWNNECVRITQFTRNEVLTKKIEYFIDDSARDRFGDFLNRIFNKEHVDNIEIYLKAKASQKIHVLINATPKASNDNVVGILFVGQDITELSAYRNKLEDIVRDRTDKLKKALEKEKELVDIKNKFVSMASHEFRIPLSNISSHIGAVRENRNLSTDDHERLAAIEKQVGHMRALIDDVLTIGKTEVGKIVAKQKTIDLIAFLERIIEEVNVNANNSHLIRFTHSDQSIEIESDDKLLRNIFMNLLSNAIKFSPGQKEIELDVNKKLDLIEAKISDKGIGIAEEDQQRVFEPFNRGSNAETIRGTGLGLSIVKRAVEALNGSIELLSQPNKGTTFVLKFKTNIYG